MSSDKPELTEEDVSTVAACVAFLGTNLETADNFSQALLDVAESLTTGLCVRCGEIPGVGKADCMICQGIRNVHTLKLVKQNSHIDRPESDLGSWTTPIEPFSQVGRESGR